MKKRFWLWEEIRMWAWRHAKYKHGGCLHQDVFWNDLIAFRGSIPPEAPAVQYESKYQKYWLKLYYLLSK